MYFLVDYSCKHQFWFIRALFQEDTTPPNGNLTIVTKNTTIPPTDTDMADEPPPADDILQVSADTSPIVVGEVGAMGMSMEIDQQPVQKATGKRSRARFAQRKLLGSSFLFSTDSRPIDGISGHLVGVVKECPNKKNGQRYRIDWLAHLVGMPATADRSKVNEVLLVQWRDNRVVNCVSTLLNTQLEDTQRREGQNVCKQLKVPHPLKEYHRYMFGVDKGDQQRMHLGGFARKSHYIKWSSGSASFP